ncbi:PfkB family carbohydrate kinase [Limosilactobacillus fermentum]|nr:PfkB family carbohydrate kinase [Limosilactobacillus fermentum]
MTNRIAVLGSINVDTTYHVARFPEPGETLSATDKSSAPGARGLTKPWPLLVPGRTTFIGMVGADNEGRFMREALQEDGVDTQFVGNDVRHGTGTALVTLDANGQNDIMVYGGQPGDDHRRVRPDRRPVGPSRLFG